MISVWRKLAQVYDRFIAYVGPKIGRDGVVCHMTVVSPPELKAVIKAIGLTPKKLPAWIKANCGEALSSLESFVPTSTDAGMAGEAPKNAFFLALGEVVPANRLRAQLQEASGVELAPRADYHVTVGFPDTGDLHGAGVDKTITSVERFQEWLKSFD